MPSERFPTRALAVAVCVYAALALWHFQALLACPDACFVDHAALHGDLARLARNDTRLNAWILASVQRNLLSDPAALFEANSFHPARGVLAGSEHLIGLAATLLPLRAVTASAVAVHQMALVLSAWLLGLSTFALALWAVRVPWIALAAGAVAMAMPWRSLELMHLQILSAHWIPLLWLLALRLLAGEARRGEAPLFAALLALQLLSSFYVAYLAAVSLGVLALLAAAQRATRRRGALRLAVATLPGIALLVATSIPYLARRARGEIPVVPELLGERPGSGAAIAAAAWQALASRGLGAQRAGDAVALGYSIPAAVAALALLGVALVARRAADPLHRRQRVAALSLAGIALAGFALMLGNALELGGLAIELPAGWAARILPGFASLRAPLRWGILVSLAAPILGAIALARLDEFWRRRLGPRRGCLSVALPALALLAADLYREPLGVEPVFEDPESVRARSAALAALPPGPVLEAPWGGDPRQLLATDSLDQLASTLHWRPILNGFTAYPPPSYALLRRVARHLPEPTALESLGRLTGLRWIVLHRDRVAAGGLRAWTQAVEERRLRRVWSDAAAEILEVPERPGSGELVAALASTAPRDRTLGGVARAPLSLEAPAGRLLAPDAAPLRMRAARPAELPIGIGNESDVDWPGLDARSEGLVLLRYAFADASGAFVSGATTPLDADLPAGSVLRTRALVLPPARPGSYRLCLDLVQRAGGGLHALPVPALELEVEVAGGAPIRPRGESVARLQTFAGWLAGEPEVASYACAPAR
jgi:hypothetical protein